MAHHYKSDCKQCYRYFLCQEECQNPDLIAQRNEIAQKSGKPFIYHNPKSRKEYQKRWIRDGMPISMSNHDCFKSPEERLRDQKTKTFKEEN